MRFMQMRERKKKTNVTHCLFELCCVICYNWCIAFWNWFVIRSWLGTVLQRSKVRTTCFWNFISIPMNFVRYVHTVVNTEATQNKYKISFHIVACRLGSFWLRCTECRTNTGINSCLTSTSAIVLQYSWACDSFLTIFLSPSKPFCIG